MEITHRQNVGRKNTEENNRVRAKMDTDPLAVAGKVDEKAKKEDVWPAPWKKKKKKKRMPHLSQQ
jgi:hypothetical protein